MTNGARGGRNAAVKQATRSAGSEHQNHRALESDRLEAIVAELKRNGQVELAGRGRGARWEVVR
jgi:hypothetical protein